VNCFVRSVLLRSTLLLLALSLLVPAGEMATVSAKNRRSASSKAQASKSASKKCARRAPVSRTYTVRGNPQITRRVSIELLAEKLPELAALVGVDPSVSAVASASPTLDAVTGTSGSSRTGSYHDSELDENEDSDRITAEDEEELSELPDDINVFYNEFTSYMAALNHEPNVTANGIDKQVVMESVVSWLGTRYLFGGMTRSGIDCSAFTGTVYRALDFKLPRTAAMQYQVGAKVDRDELQFGDLVFFNTRKAVYVSHVGMYLGNGMFVHASSRNGVTVSSLDADYYSSHMIGARRYTMSSVASIDEQEPLERN
jgi:cell wall-associated NlpC family hydrolase